MTKTITLKLTPLEAKALWALVGEGAGLLTDDVAAKAYIGNKASIAAANAVIEKVRVGFLEARQ
jgi:hypothetical protein